MVERDQHVGQHQRQIREPERVRIRLAERLCGAHEVVREHPDRAAGERRQVVQRRRLEAAELVRGERVRVTVVAERPAEHTARPEADERVAADAALVGRFEQERRSRLAELQERGDRGLAVVDERLTDGDQVVTAGELARLLERWLQAAGGASGGRPTTCDGHRGPSQRRRSSGPGP